MSSPPAPMSTAGAMAPLVAIVFLGFLSVGMPLAALALHLHDAMGFGPAMVGAVIGAQSLATVATRHVSGTICDRFGPRRSALIGLPLAALAGVVMLVATLILPAGHLLVVPLLLLARAALGMAESFFLTGTMTWGIGRMGPARTGKVMAWQGIAMYAALGVGAPLGLWLLQHRGFGSVMVLAILAPLLGTGIALVLRGTAGSAGLRLPFHRVVGLIWRPGMVLGLAGLAFTAVTTFLPLHYQALGWAGAGLAMTGFVAGYIGVRLFLAHLPDRQGGMVVGAASLAAQFLGQMLLWWAPLPWLALLGAVVTGIGFSLIFPAMGVEATRRVPASQRGQAVGNFIAFFDLSLGLGGPLLGLASAFGGSATPFLVGALTTAAGLLLLRRMPPAPVPGQA
ncbi:MFS transporter [Roseomonas marmotae]|uniref:MFS transporter n=1 Tax=Roseomonas marmotae TaxID=2768161 RepID=A0ABS3KE11_9PROT|nr:MFS transporter [Roseomonas marmotae]MBO1075712.1 MFS transporter [Roseomonas marmotae]QTI80443.1 MFS transporter [Roseomonas marmotae]